MCLFAWILSFFKPAFFNSLYLLAQFLKATPLKNKQANKTPLFYSICAEDPSFMTILCFATQWSNTRKLSTLGKAEAAVWQWSVTPSLSHDSSKEGF